MRRSTHKFAHLILFNLANTELVWCGGLGIWHRQCRNLCLLVFARNVRIVCRCLCRKNINALYKHSQRLLTLAHSQFFNYNAVARCIFFLHFFFTSPIKQSRTILFGVSYFNCLVFVLKHGFWWRSQRSFLWTVLIWCQS